jgi:hypothetical protein
MHAYDDRETHRRRDVADAGNSDLAGDGTRRRLQRIVRSNDVRVRDMSSPPQQPKGPPSLSDQRAAHLSPQLVNPAAAVSDEGVQFQCTECDMMVRESDPYCPFCGAIFADGPMSSPEAAADASEAPPAEAPEQPRERGVFFRPEKFDVFGMMKSKGRAHELLYQEAVKGFAGSARLLEEIEHQISDISSLGNDTTRARRLMSSAWEACREGNWILVSALARQTEEAISPSIPGLVRSELAKAREHLMAARSAGRDASEYLLRMKAAMHCLKSGDDDEALRLTKELMDLLRQDSVSWREGGSPSTRSAPRSSH